MKQINLLRDWILIFLPHVLAKVPSLSNPTRIHNNNARVGMFVHPQVHRVGYGLLTAATLETWRRSEGDRYHPPPKSRRLLAVPFVALEAPSRNSEFAHPEVLIGLSILAYRYEGLRMDDLKGIVRSLKTELAAQPGTFAERPASIIFMSWLSQRRQQTDESDEDEVLHTCLHTRLNTRLYTCLHMPRHMWIEGAAARVVRTGR